MSSTPSGEGYWVADDRGTVSVFGDAAHHGDLRTVPLYRPVVAMVSTPSGGGYWLGASDGGVFAFGDAPFRGSLGDVALNQPIVGLAGTASGGGYWMVASDGGVFAFGDAVFHGSLGGVSLNAPIVNMAATASGNGYWLVAADGGVFTFGDAVFFGSAGDVVLNEPIVDIGVAPRGGYWMAGADGGIFTYGMADFLGALDGAPLGRVVDLEVSPDGGGYWMLPSGLALGHRCQGNGYEVSFPDGWSTNDGSVTEPCRYFRPESFTVPASSELLDAAVTIEITSVDADAYLTGVRSHAGSVHAQTTTTVDRAPATVIEWVSSGDTQLPDGARSYAYVVPLPDGRTLTLLTRSLAASSYDVDKAIVDQMVGSLDILTLAVSTGADTNDAPAATASLTLADVRLSRAPGFDRLVLELDQEAEPAWDVRYVEGPARRPGSGETVDVEGSALLHISVRPVRTADIETPGQPVTYRGPDRLTGTNLGNVTEAVLLGDFEANLEVVVGVTQRAGFRAFYLPNPSRVVIDINH